jgi:hypothetical protein
MTRRSASTALLVTLSLGAAKALAYAREIHTFTAKGHEFRVPGTQFNSRHAGEASQKFRLPDRKSVETKKFSTFALALALASATVTSAGAAALQAERPATAQSTRLPVLHVSAGFRQVSAVGATKPPGAALDDRQGTTPSLDADSHRVRQLIRSSICRGC